MEPTSEKKNEKQQQYLWPFNNMQQKPTHAQTPQPVQAPPQFPGYPPANVVPVVPPAQQFTGNVYPAFPGQQQWQQQHPAGYPAFPAQQQSLVGYAAYPAQQQHPVAYPPFLGQQQHPVDVHPEGAFGQWPTKGWSPPQQAANLTSQPLNTLPENAATPKRALIIGCNYPTASEKLKSCVNDAIELKYLLQEHCGYRDEDVRILVDDPLLQENWPLPTRQNIIKSMKWLVRGAKSGDQLFFHFSGHGTQSKDHSGAEKWNQCLMPTDYQLSGVLVDDDINRYLIHPLPEGCTLHALVDCCHSGTIMDLQFEAKKGLWDDGGSARRYKGTNGGRVFQFAACRDREKAYEQGNDEEGEQCCGAATAAFISAITDVNNQPATYASVLSHMKEAVKVYADKAHQDHGFWPRLHRQVKIACGRLYQKPQLSSNTDSIPLNTEICL